MIETIQAPWTPEQVADLNWFQESGWHEYTCGTPGCRTGLIATASGWRCPRCTYTQNWVDAGSMEIGHDRITPADAIKGTRGKTT